MDGKRENFTLGIGMDSVKRFGRDWDLLDNEGNPIGHFHSTPLQLVIERGLPAFLIWLWVLFVYGKILLRKIQDFRVRIQDSKPEILNPNSEIRHSFDWKVYGIILGCFGGMIGFFTGGLVHYNLGDSEVAMAFYMLMAVGVFLSAGKAATE